MTGKAKAFSNLCMEGKIALIAFLSTIVLLNIQLYLLMYSNLDRVLHVPLIICDLLLLIFSPQGPVVRRSALLGAAFGGALWTTFFSTQYRLFGLYMTFLSFFHFSEYIVTAIYKPDSLKISSFLLNHSFEYQVAAVASWTEFFIELYLFPAFKTFNFVSCTGLVLVVFGESMRKLAMITAGSNFHHIVQTRKAKGHQLVTSGIYSLVRHPSYSGWFCWSVGTQILLCNPICLIGYAVASWQFFDDRIKEEEHFLIQFFGEDYVTYMLKVPTGVPFNTGLEKEVKGFIKSG